MRFFLVRTLLFFVLFNICCWAGAPWLRRDFGNSNIYAAISLISDNPKAHKIILGDSVGEQIYPGSKSTKTGVLCATTNRAIGVVGQLLLLKHFLNTRAAKKEQQVHIILHPGSYGARLDEKYTFNYFLQPFRDHLCELQVPSDIKSSVKPPFLMALLQFVPPSRIVPYDLFSGNTHFAPMRSSPEIMDYTKWAMNKMDSIAETGVEIHLHCAPLQSNWQDSTYSDLSEYFNSFQNLNFHYDLDDILFIESKYSQDGIHFNSDGLDDLGQDPLQLLD